MFDDNCSQFGRNGDLALFTVESSSKSANRTSGILESVTNAIADAFMSSVFIALHIEHMQVFYLEISAARLTDWWRTASSRRRSPQLRSTQRARRAVNSR